MKVMPVQYLVHTTRDGRGKGEITPLFAVLIYFISNYFHSSVWCYLLLPRSCCCCNSISLSLYNSRFHFPIRVTLLLIAHLQCYQQQVNEMIKLIELAMEKTPD